MRPGYPLLVRRALPRALRFLALAAVAPAAAGDEAPAPPAISGVAFERTAARGDGLVVRGEVGAR